MLEDWQRPMCFSALYWPPKHRITANAFKNFFASLGNRFISGGDFNARHSWWGCRINNPKGRQQYSYIRNYKPSIYWNLYTGKPAYWLSDLKHMSVKSSFDISTDINPSKLSCTRNP